MRPDCDLAWSEIRAHCVRQIDEQTDRQTAGISDMRVKEVSQNTCIDRLIQYIRSRRGKKPLLNAIFQEA